MGLAPDRALVRGSRTADPPRPRFHVWEIRCDESGLRIDEQIERVIVRVEPIRTAIRDLVAEPGDVRAWLQMVRYFHAEDGDEEVIDETPEGLVKLSGQHQLLGWHVDRRVLSFLSDIGADLDADEYG